MRCCVSRSVKDVRVVVMKNRNMLVSTTPHFQIRMFADDSDDVEPVARAADDETDENVDIEERDVEEGQIVVAS